MGNPCVSGSSPLEIPFPHCLFLEHQGPAMLRPTTLLQKHSLRLSPLVFFFLNTEFHSPSWLKSSWMCSAKQRAIYLCTHLPWQMRTHWRQSASSSFPVSPHQIKSWACPPLTVHTLTCKIFMGESFYNQIWFHRSVFFKLTLLRIHIPHTCSRWITK